MPAGFYFYRRGGTSVLQQLRAICAAVTPARGLLLFEDESQ